MARFELYAFAESTTSDSLMLRIDASAPGLEGLESSRNYRSDFAKHFRNADEKEGDSTVTKEEQIELGKKLLGEMRAAFARSDWDETTNTYEQLEGIKTDRAINLEATCLAVRALVAAKERAAARQLLTRVSATEYKKPAHYEFLARAYLDLKRYKDAAAACERAEELRIAELK